MQTTCLLRCLVFCEVNSVGTKLFGVCPQSPNLYVLKFETNEASSQIHYIKSKPGYRKESSKDPEGDFK